MLAALSRAGDANLRLWMTVMAMPKTMMEGMPMTRAATMGQKVSSSTLLVSGDKARPLLLPLDPTIRVVFSTEGVALVVVVVVGVVVVEFSSETVTSPSKGGVAVELRAVLLGCAAVVLPLLAVVSAAAVV